MPRQAKIFLARGGNIITASHSDGLRHYAWVIVLVVFGIQAASTAVRLAFGTFVEPLGEEFGWSKGSIGFAYALQFIVSALFAPVAGWSGEVYGVRRTVWFGVGVFTLGMTLTGTITHLWQFYLYYSVLVGASLAIFMVPMVISVTYWFKTHKGLAMGIVMASTGVGPMIAAPTVIVLVNSIGWGPAMVASGLTSGILMLSLAFFYHGRPIEKGLRPLGADQDDDIVGSYSPKEAKARASAFIHRARGTKNFWTLISIHFLGCVGHSIVIVYASSIAINRGIDPIAAAGIVSIFAAVSVITRFSTPILSEHFNPKTVMVVSYFLQGATVLGLLVSDASWHFYVFAVAFGVGYGGEGSVFPMLNSSYYKDAPVGTAYGWQLSGASLGMALGGWIGGYLYDLTGTYTITIVLSAATSLAGMISVMFLANPKMHLIADWKRYLPIDYQAVPNVR